MHTVAGLIISLLPCPRMHARPLNRMRLHTFQWLAQPPCAPMRQALTAASIVPRWRGGCRSWGVGRPVANGSRLLLVRLGLRLLSHGLDQPIVLLRKIR